MATGLGIVEGVPDAWVPAAFRGADADAAAGAAVALEAVAGGAEPDAPGAGGVPAGLARVAVACAGPFAVAPETATLVDGVAAGFALEGMLF